MALKTGDVAMAMRKKAASTAKVRSAWRCPGCGYKVETVECYGCLIESRRDKKRSESASRAEYKGGRCGKNDAR